jgi:hypothetical protein
LTSAKNFVTFMEFLLRQQNRRMSDVVLEGTKSWIIEKWRQRWKKRGVLTLAERSSAARASAANAV